MNSNLSASRVISVTPECNIFMIKLKLAGTRLHIVDEVLNVYAIFPAARIVLYTNCFDYSYTLLISSALTRSAILWHDRPATLKSLNEFSIACD